MGGRTPLFVVHAVLALGVALSSQSDRPQSLPALPAFLPGTEPPAKRGDQACQAVLVVRREGPRRQVPVKGARVACWTEEGPEVLRARLVAEAETDAWGVAVLQGPAGEGRVGEGYHWLVTAPGLAPCYESAGFGLLQPWPIVLERSPECTLRLLDPMGGNLAGARVELLPGCPHSPASHAGTTDSEGVVVLGPVGHHVYLWIEAPGVAPLGYDLPRGAPGGPPPVLLTRPGKTAAGVVVDEQGRPVAGAVVRELCFGRGPAASTDAQGRFTLHGCRGDQALGVFLSRPPFGDSPASIVREFTEGRPLRIPLAADRATSLVEGEARHLARVVLDPGVRALPLSEVEIRCVRLSDGFTARARHDSWGDSFELPPGRYSIVVTRGFHALVWGAAEADVPTPGGAPVRIPLSDESHGVLADFPEEASGLGRCEVRIPGALQEVEPDGFSRINVPKDEPAMLVLFTPRPALFPFVPRPDIPVLRNATVVLPDPVMVRLRVVDLEGRPVAAAARLCEDEARLDPAGGEGRLVLATRGRDGADHTLEVRAPGFKARDLSIVLPQNPAAVDLGDVVLAPEREQEFPPLRIRVLDGSGRPAESISLFVLEKGSVAWQCNQRDESGHFLLAPEGHESWPLPVLVECQGFLPLETTLAQEPFHEIRFPAGSIEVRPRAPSGEALDGVVLLEGLLLETKQGVARLSGMPDGRRTILVGALGYRVAARVVELERGGAARLEVELEPR